MISVLASGSCNSIILVVHDLSIGFSSMQCTVYDALAIAAWLFSHLHHRFRDTIPHKILFVGGPWGNAALVPPRGSYLVVGVRRAGRNTLQQDTTTLCPLAFYHLVMRVYLPCVAA